MNRASRALPRALVFAICMGQGTVSVVHADTTSDYQAGKRAYAEDDVVTAMQYLERAARAGHADALLLLGYIYDKAEENTLALDYFRRSADAGNAEAAWSIGSMYAAGDGVERDLPQALDWFRRAATGGHGPAMETLGLAYIDGRLGLDKDPEKGWELLREAAEAGDESAKARLAQREGEGR